MTKKLLLSTLLLSGIASASEVLETNATEVKTEKSTMSISTGTTRSSGWYAGVGMGLLNWGGEVEIDDGYRSKNFDVDTEDTPLVLKVGYVTESENRIEVYYKSDSIEAEEDGHSFDMYDTSTFGINYEWGISSFSTNEILPFIGVGVGFGSAEFDDVSTDLDAVEVTVAVGAHYQVASNIDISGSIYRRAIGVTADDSDASIMSALNGIDISANYHF